MEEFGNISVLEEEEINFDVLCIVKTWFTSTPKRVPKSLAKYESFHSDAIREKSRERASGGLAVFVNKDSC